MVHDMVEGVGLGAHDAVVVAELFQKTITSIPYDKPIWGVTEPVVYMWPMLPVRYVAVGEGPSTSFIEETEHLRARWVSKWLEASCLRLESGNGRNSLFIRT